jgi:hypothetical protein
MFLVDTVFIYDRLVGMLQSDVPLMLLESDGHGTICLPNIDPAAITMHPVKHLMSLILAHLGQDE